MWAEWRFQEAWKKPYDMMEKGGPQPDKGVGKGPQSKLQRLRCVGPPRIHASWKTRPGAKDSVNASFSAPR